MANIEETIGVSSEEFWKIFREIEKRKAKKGPVNTGPNLSQQLKTFGEISFDEQDEKELHKDALSVCALTTTE